MMLCNSAARRHGCRRKRRYSRDEGSARRPPTVGSPIPRTTGGAARFSLVGGSEHVRRQLPYGTSSLKVGGPVCTGIRSAGPYETSARTLLLPRMGASHNPGLQHLCPLAGTLRCNLAQVGRRVVEESVCGRNGLRGQRRRFCTRCIAGPAPSAWLNGFGPFLQGVAYEKACSGMPQRGGGQRQQ